MRTKPELERFERDYAWCYPLKSFELIDVDSGYKANEAGSSIKEYVISNNWSIHNSNWPGIGEPNKVYENYGQVPSSIWFDGHYSITTEFMKDNEYFDTHLLKVRIVNYTDK